MLPDATKLAQSVPGNFRDPDDPESTSPEEALVAEQPEGHRLFVSQEAGTVFLHVSYWDDDEWVEDIEASLSLSPADAISLGRMLEAVGVRPLGAVLCRAGFFARQASRELEDQLDGSPSVVTGRTDG